MSTYIQISNEFKQTALETSKAQITNELFRVCLEHGIDPETIDLENPITAELQVTLDALDAPVTGYVSSRIKTLAQGYLLVQEKIASITA